MTERMPFQSTDPAGHRLTAGQQAPDRLSPQARRAVVGATVGFVIDNFDIYLPITVLAPALGYFVSPSLPAASVDFYTSIIFAVTLAARPVGAILFGHLADSIGRRKTSLIAATGFGVCTLLIAALPGFQSWGGASLALLIALRGLDGFFLGGQYTSATPLAMEQSPKSRRGLAGGIVQGGAAIAFTLISSLTLLLLTVMPSASLDSSYVQWGWRIPFIVGGVGSLAYGWYMSKVPESELWRKKESSRRGIAAMASQRNVKAFLQVFIFMTGMWFILDSFTAIMPLNLVTVNGLTSSQKTLAIFIMSALLLAGYVLSGVRSQRIGRRRYFLRYIPFATVVGGIGYGVLAALGTGSGVAAVMVVAVVGSVCLDLPWSVVSVYITERFRTESRGTGFGMGYTVASVIPAFYAYYQRALVHFMPSAYTVVVFIVAGGLLATIGAAMGPETKDIDFGANESM